MRRQSSNSRLFDRRLRIGAMRLFQRGKTGTLGAGPGTHQTHMIARLWRGVASSSAMADAYERHVTRNVFPQLAAIPGHRGARVLRREDSGRVEFVMTFWDSMDAVRRFAGDNLTLQSSNRKLEQC